MVGDMKRHAVAKIFLAILLFLCCIPTARDVTAEEELAKTPADYEGPFYPVTRQDDIDNDLIHVNGMAGVAKGDILNLSGRVVNTMGKPQEGLVIEIWQTDPLGRYKHPGDSTPGARDQNFQYWGAAVTESDGSYFFKTIVPGAYHPRPAHIHYKVLKDGKLILTSQIYFTKSPEGAKPPSLTGQMELQSVTLKPTAKGEFEAYFQIVI